MDITQKEAEALIERAYSTSKNLKVIDKLDGMINNKRISPDDFDRYERKALVRLARTLTSIEIEKYKINKKELIEKLSEMCQKVKEIFVLTSMQEAEKKFEGMIPIELIELLSGLNEKQIKEGIDSLSKKRRLTKHSKHFVKKVFSKVVRRQEKKIEKRKKELSKV